MPSSRQPQPSATRPGSPAASTVQVPVRWLAGLAGLVVTPWIIVAALYFGPSLVPAAPSAPHPDPAVPFLTDGPWGHLSITPVTISPPLEYVPEDWGRNGAPEWAFPGVPPAQVPAALASLGVSADVIAGLSGHIRPAPEVAGAIVRPPVETVRALPPDVRARLYGELAKSLRNPDQAHSFRFIGRSTADWFDGSRISPETRRLIEPLVYDDGTFLHFADIEAIRPLLTTPAERQVLAKTLLRNSTVMIRLHVNAEDEIPALAEYWGRGGRRTDILPLLDSIATGTGPQEIDVAHLLPSFARSFLYRYPKITTGDMNRPLLANCLWSALNFFEAVPDDRYLDVPYALEALRTRYYLVEHGFQLGDIVALVDDDGVLFHTAVYVAAGYVFTKNGTSAVAPWTLMTVDQLRQFYRSRSANPRLLYHRPNAY
jgi:hypothetical protein